MSFQVRKTADGSRNAAVEVSGFLRQEHEGKVFPFVKFEHHGLKLTGVLFLIQEKGGLYLWRDEARENLIMPLESRGVFKFDGIKGPDNWDGQIWASAFNCDAPRAFLVILEFDK